jgi:hypothetical protein
MLTPCAAYAAPQAVTSPVCPAFIAPSSVQLVNIEAGWVPFVASPLYLHAAAPMYGPPEMRGDLVETSEKRNKSEWSYTYQLDGPYPQGKWFQCTYGETNQLTLSRRLPDETAACTVTYRKGEKAGQHDIRVKCHQGASTAWLSWKKKGPGLAPGSFFGIW